MTGAEEMGAPPAGIGSKIHDGLQSLIVFEPCFGSNLRFVVAVADELQEYRNTGIQEYRNAGMQECRNAGMQECRNAGMQECRNAQMHELNVHSCIFAFVHFSRDGTS